ncbi:unnamed protein product [Dicrocoelium dendriticum]|nr:unnamed protein product [Dicrocoelium dendriticum]
MASHEFWSPSSYNTVAKIECYSPDPLSFLHNSNRHPATSYLEPCCSSSEEVSSFDMERFLPITCSIPEDAYLGCDYGDRGSHKLIPIEYTNPHENSMHQISTECLCERYLGHPNSTTYGIRYTLEKPTGIETTGCPQNGINWEIMSENRVADFTAVWKAPQQETPHQPLCNVSATPNQPSGSTRTQNHLRKQHQREQDKNRTRSLNVAFCRLRCCLPEIPKDTKLTKIRTLRYAISYIRHLMDTLDLDEGQSIVGNVQTSCLNVSWTINFAV